MLQQQMSLVHMHVTLFVCVSLFVYLCPCLWVRDFVCHMIVFVRVCVCVCVCVHVYFCM